MTRSQEIIRAARPLFDGILGELLLGDPVDMRDLDSLIDMLHELRSAIHEEHDSR